MPIPFTYSGNDDNALDALVLSAGVSFSASGNVHQSVDSVAGLMGLTLNFSGNDYNMLQALADQYTPFTFRLDDTGPFFAEVMAGDPALAWKASHPANAPDYLEASMTAVNTSIEYYSMPSAIDDCIAITDTVIAFEVDLVEAPDPLTGGFSGAFSLGANMSLLNSAGVRVRSLNAVLLVNNSQTRLRITTATPDSGSYWNDIHFLPPGVTSGRIGFYFNPSTKRVGLTYGGTDFGYVMALPLINNAAFMVPGIFMESIPTVLAGQNQRVRLYAKASEMTQPFPAGAIGLDGQVI